MKAQKKTAISYRRRLELGWTSDPAIQRDWAWNLSRSVVSAYLDDIYPMVFRVRARRR